MLRVVAMSRWCAFVSLTINLLCWNAGSLRAADSQTVEIVTKSGIRVFMVELAVTKEQVTKGLSGRKNLPEGSGMLFDFRGEVQVAMGTKDTLIPLDMIFIRADGRIHRIAENVEPLSNREIFSDGSVRAVLEVIGGTALKFGIAVGDRVGHPIFAARR